MDSSELRKACEMAGLPVTEFCVFIGRYELDFEDDEDRALIFPAVAELLVAKVRERGPETWEGFDIALTEIMPDSDTLDVLFAPAEQRIRAAMAVLGGGK